MSDLSIENLSMRFDLPNGTHVQALENINLSLKTGELMAVLGPSGCGKTTLLNIVAGFLAPTSGEIKLNEEAVYGPASNRGMVFQQGALFEWMSVKDNISFGPRMKGMPSKQIKETVDHLLAQQSVYRILVKKPSMNYPVVCSSVLRWLDAWPMIPMSF